MSPPKPSLANPLRPCPRHAEAAAGLLVLLACSASAAAPPCPGGTYRVPFRDGRGGRPIQCYRAGGFLNQCWLQSDYNPRTGQYEPQRRPDGRLNWEYNPLPLGVRAWNRWYVNPAVPFTLLMHALGRLTGRVPLFTRANPRWPLP